MARLYQFLSDCVGELGSTDDNRSINNTAFTASTFKRRFEPHNARLNSPLAWCALVNDQNQFLEIDLGRIRLSCVITWKDLGGSKAFLTTIVTTIKEPG